LLWHFYASKHIKDIAFTTNFTYLLHREHISVIDQNQRTPFSRILIVEEMLKNIEMETIKETVNCAIKELNTFVFPHLKRQGSEYDDLRKRVKKIENIISEGFADFRIAFEQMKSSNIFP
jgi:hypothetical protein